MSTKVGGDYTGEVKQGLRQGKGELFMANCDRYDGEWVNNKKEGQGNYYYHNGELYKGTW